MSLRFAVLLLILATNAFFAASEVALVSVRPSRLRELAEQGQTGAHSALSLLANPGRLLSVTQFGVTLASLGLGWAGEDTLYHLLRGALDPLGLYLGTRSGQLFGSRDEGKSWERILEGLPPIVCIRTALVEDTTEAIRPARPKTPAANSTRRTKTSITRKSQRKSR